MSKRVLVYVAIAGPIAGLVLGAVVALFREPSWQERLGWVIVGSIIVLTCSLIGIRGAAHSEDTGQAQIVSEPNE